MRERAVSPVVSVVLVVFITIALAVGIFVMLGGLGSEQGTSPTGYSDFSSSGATYSATVMDGGTAEKFKYRVNGNLVYTLVDVQNSVGDSIPLSEYAQLCAGDELTVIGVSGSSETILQTETISQNINCVLPGTDTSTTAGFDGTSWIVETSLTNTGTEQREYTIVLTDGDTYETTETVTLNPGESTTISTTTDSFAEDAPLQIGIISPSDDAESYSLSGGSLGGGGSTVSYSTSSSPVSSSFTYVSTSDSSTSDSSTGSGSTTDSSTLADKNSQSPVSLSASRIGTGEEVNLFATLTTTKETADETLVVRATDTAGTTTEKTRTTYSLSNGEYKQAVEAFSFETPGEYVITATLEGTGEIHTAGSLTVVEQSDITVASTSYTPTSPRVGDDITVEADLSNAGTADGEVTVQFFEMGEVYNEQVVTVPAGGSKTVSATMPATEERMYKFHVGVVEPAIIEHVGDMYVSPDSKVSVSASVSPNPPTTNEEATFSTSATHTDSVAITEYQWTFGDGTTETTTDATVTHAYTSSGAYDYSVTAIAEDGEQATSGGSMYVKTQTTALSEGFENGYDGTFQDTSQSSVSPRTTNTYAHSGDSALDLQSTPGTSTSNSVTSKNVFSGAKTYTVYLNKYNDNGGHNTWGIQLQDVESSARIGISASGYENRDIYAQEWSDEGTDTTGRLRFRDELPTGQWYLAQIRVVDAETVELQVDGDTYTVETTHDWTQKTVELRLFANSWGGGHNLDVAYDDVTVE